MEIIQLDIQGMTCAACVSHVEKAIKKVDGVDLATVNLATEQATVSFDPAVAQVATIIESVIHAGYSACITTELDAKKKSEKKDDELRRLKRRVIIAVILCAPLLGAMLAGVLKISSLMFLHNPVLQLILATPVQFWIGWRFYKGAWSNIKSLSPGMDLLVALGTSSAYIFSIFNGFIASRVGVASTGLYFEASAVIITLVLLGKYLEAKAKGKTSEAIKKLMGLQPQSASVERNGELIVVPISDVLVGDIIHIRPGERIPVDGIIISGNTAVDESMVTGESIPVEKESGDKLISGTINSYGTLKFRAEHVGKDSVLSRIISIVEEAQGSKAPIQKIADKVAAIFVPAVLGIALLTFLVWWLVVGSLPSAIIAAVAVLVIACPCSLGLATPTAIMVGTGIGAQRGILIKNGEVLQLSGKLNAVVLDKTGTLTQGRPQLQRVVPLTEDKSKEQVDYLFQLAASIEYNSEHPLAKAVVQAAKAKGYEFIEVDSFYAVAGKGVEAIIANTKYYVGTEKFLRESGIATAEAMTEKSALEEEGNTVVILSDAQKPLALLVIADKIKATSVSAIATLKALGLDIYMITGDNERTARAIAGSVGITNVLAGVLPEGKSSEVQKLQRQGKIVAMVGDGINDAPALATADVGIAMGEGSDIALESADVTLMRGDLNEIAAAIQLSRKTMSKIKQNLFWAFFYNAIGIPVAALGFLNPMIAGAAMAFSSVSVVSNSLSLRQFKFQPLGCNEDNSDAINCKSISKEKIMEFTLTVEGMSCQHCKNHVEKAALGVAGVLNAEVDLDRKELTLALADDNGNIEEVKKVVTEAGYPVS